eukprot:TRINITY_DN18031_c0_g1_i3.p1 TRINITY_DN18031_c0_g1~~TRINITY_DN18031_c0_g1_i3.p1  ORF type:complete len:329 (+),score=44.03 TRINITY_DN18031_c0_g1_i3:77-1063(+)
MDRDAEVFFAATNKLQPKDMAKLRSSMDTFMETARSAERRVVVITSGGTTVPLELNTVRFIDNFSTGTRGALCTEQFLRAGYAVLFLHRTGSNFPYLTEMVQKLRSDPVSLLRKPCKSEVPDECERWFLPIGFTTLFEYLFLLREAAQSLQAVEASGMLYLAAAVSDFYVPESEMEAEKIQSRGADGLTIKLQNVPKLLGALKIWAPEAFVVSFKLETNPNILRAKAAGALKKYGVDVVCSNLLQSTRDAVTLVARDPQVESITIHCDTIDGNEAKAILVTGVTDQDVRRQGEEAIEVPLVKAVLDLHSSQLDKARAANGKEAKRRRT